MVVSYTINSWHCSSGNTLITVFKLRVDTGKRTLRPAHQRLNASATAPMSPLCCPTKSTVRAVLRTISAVFSPAQAMETDAGRAYCDKKKITERGLLKKMTSKGEGKGDRMGEKCRKECACTEN